MPVTSVPADLPFMRMASALQAHARNLSNAVHWMHPSHIQALLELDDAQFDRWTTSISRASNQAVRNVSLALCRYAGIVNPSSAHTWTEPVSQTGAEGVRLNAGLLDVCAPPTGLQILRMRALWFRRTETRRIIDKRVRVQLSEWAGVRLDMLLNSPYASDSPDMAELQMRFGAPALADLDAQALCAEGLALIERDVGAAAGEVLQVLRYALPHALTVPHWLSAANPQADKRGTARVFEGLAQWLPEWAWLFG
ncbi:type III secretion protein HrpB4 [Paraburkholderia humisilvae]|uniref:Type III secretion protein HrpB4 n=1 Tax=Paraburkholderia humisilvae TaxID=627669 RepID=A0A6J5EGL4_9BURK|nr:type III secretion protein HrpB4 [Paraburkholderia humisilvae]CAB3764332.1 hypothetical protein LMG29542_04865 [Paraburkholderia humisilvae]